MIMHEIQKARYPFKKTLLFDFAIPLLLVALLTYYLDRQFARMVLQYLVDLPYLGLRIYHSPIYTWYVHYHRYLFAGPLLFFAVGVSYRTARIPGPGRAFRRFWQGLLHRDLSDNTPMDSFPPLFNRQDPGMKKFLAGWALKSPHIRILGYYKRFVSDIEKDKREGRKVEKPGQYFNIVLREEQRYRHMQVLGNTGSGKSWSILAPMLLEDAASSHFATVTMNGKADLYMLKVLATGAMRAAPTVPTAILSFHHKVSLAYDPLLYGDADSLTKKIMNSSEINHAHYRPFQESWLMGFFRVMRTEPEINGTIMLKQLYHYLKRPKALLDHLGKRCKDPDNLALLHELAETDPESLSGLAAHIGSLVLDESLSHIFDNPTGRTLNLRDLIEKAGNLYLDLDTSSKGPQARALGRMIIMELQLLAGARQAGKALSTIGVQGYLDEFGSFAYNEFINMLDKCRSSKIGFLIAHQSIGNLERPNLASSFMKELVDNTYQKFFLNISAETAAWAAEQMGERKVTKRSLSIGQMTDKTHIHGRDSHTVSYREELEKYVQTSDLTLDKGYGFGIFESEGRLIKAPVRFGYVDPSELCSDAELQAFLERALLSHATRPYKSEPVADAHDKDEGNDPGEGMNSPPPPKPNKPRPAGGKDSPLGRIIKDKKPEGES